MTARAMGEQDRERSFAERVAEVATAQPDAPALLGEGGRRVTYGQLVERASAVAGCVERHSAVAAPVAILCRDDVDSIVAALGVRWAGRPFAVLDAASPAARLSQVLDLSQAATVLTDDVPWVRELLGPAAVDVRSLDDAAAGPPLAAPVAAEDGVPACIIFTSGSTGAPKGVAWTDRTIMSDCFVAQQGLGVRPGDVVSLVMPAAFAAGLTAVVFSLAAGAALAVCDARRVGPSEVAARLEADGANVVACTPSLLRSMAEAMPASWRRPDVRLVASVGEAAQRDDIVMVRSRYPQATYVNWFGSTEVATLAYLPIGPGDELPSGPVPAGVPVPGKEVVVLGEDGEPVPAGTSGSLLVRSAYLSAGYWQAPDTTRERFVPTADGRVELRTGDLARLRPDGVLEPLGREDAAVKIRGYLVEPSEVEAVLAGVAEVAEVHVLAETPEGGLPQLVAFVVPAAGASVSPPALRRVVRDHLPPWMVPARIVLVPALPRTERGKVDRAALRELPRPAEAPPVEPRDELESAVADIWARALGLETVGVDDDFVALGGDSLAVEEILAAIQDSFGLAAPSSWLVEAPTVAELAARIRDGRGALASRSSVLTLRAGGSQPPLFCIPGAGGIGFVFLSLAEDLAVDRPVLVLESHGLEQRQLPSYTVRQAARRQIREVRRIQPHGPYHLVGHSFGGLVAQEMAVQLTAAGERVDLLAIVDGFAPGSAYGHGSTDDGSSEGEGEQPSTGRGRGRDLLGLPGRIVRRFWGEGNSFSRSTPGNLLRMATAGPVRHQGRAHYDAFYRRGIVMTQLHRGRPYRGRAVLYAAVDGRPEGVDPAEPWRALISGGVEVVDVPGDHHSLLREPNVAVLAEHLGAELGGCEPVADGPAADASAGAGFRER